MRALVFRNGTGLPEYPVDHIRRITLLDSEDELEAVQRYMSNDSTLREYIGVAIDIPDREFRNAWVSNSSFRVDFTLNVGNPVVVSVNLQRARKIRYANLLARRRDVMDRLTNRIADARLADNDAAVALLGVRLARLQSLDDNLATAVRMAATLTELKAITHPDLED